MTSKTAKSKIDVRLVLDPLAPIAHLPERQRKLVCEMRTEYQLSAARAVGANLSTCDAVAAYVAPRIAALEFEQLVVVPVDCHMCALSEPIVVSRGDAQGTEVHAAQIMRTVLRFPLATSFMLAHNHPSGQVRPSSQDIAVTTRIAKVGREVEVRLNDHIIVVPGGTFTSIRIENPSCFC